MNVILSVVSGCKRTNIGKRVENTTSKVEVQAPSKVILTGENAVVFGATALACAVDLSNTCTISVWDNRYFRVSIGHIVAEFDQMECRDVYRQAIKLCELSNHKQIEKILQKKPLAWIRAVLGRLLEEGINVPYFAANVALAVPLGSGVGGSATLTVLILKGVAGLCGWILSDERLYELSFLGDRIAHGGSASGTDSATIVYGGFVSYQRDRGYSRKDTDWSLRLLLCDSGERVESGISLTEFRHYKDKDQKEFSKNIAEFDNISRQAIELLEKPCDMKKLGDIMNKNQYLLQKMGVSTAEIDRIVQKSLELGAFGAKVTGGCRGGIVVIVVDAESQERITAELSDRGKEVYYVKTKT